MLKILYLWVKFLIIDQHYCQIHSYPWSAIAPVHTPSCSCTAARFTHTFGQPLHLLILYPVPALLPDTLILLVSHCTCSYSILFLHCCQVHSYLWSAIAPSHTLSCSCTTARYTHTLGQPLHLFILHPVPALQPGKPWSATAPSHTPSCSCTTARYTHTLGQPLHLLILHPVPALLPGTLIPLVSHCTFSYSILFLHYCQIHSYSWSAIAPAYTPSCSCTTARYTHTLGQPLHLLILYPVPALLPDTLIPLVSHCTCSYSILFLHCSQVNLGSHCTISYSILFLHYCQVHTYPWSAIAPAHTPSCSCTTARYTHTLGQPLHLLILHPVPALLPGTLKPLVSHCTFSYSILFLHYCQIHSYLWSAIAPAHTPSCSCTAAR